MKKYLKQFGFTVLLLVLIISIWEYHNSNIIEKNTELVEIKKELKKIKNNLDFYIEQLKSEKSINKAEVIKKADCWRDFVNTEYGFTIRYLAEECDNRIYVGHFNSGVEKEILSDDMTNVGFPYVNRDRPHGYSIMRGVDKKNYIENALFLVEDKQNMFYVDGKKVNVYEANGMRNPTVLEIVLNQTTSIFLDTPYTFSVPDNKEIKDFLSYISIQK